MCIRDRAKGDVIFPCDQDDIWHTDKIEKMTKAFEDNSDIWLLISGYHAFSENRGKMAIQQKEMCIRDRYYAKE